MRASYARPANVLCTIQETTETSLGNDSSINIDILPLSYSFREHRARYHILFSIETNNDYGDGSLYLYEDNNEYILSEYIDDNIMPSDVKQIISIIENNFSLSDRNKNEYIIPDCS